MRAGRPKVELVLSDEERAQLQAFARSRSLPAALRQCARIVLGCTEGEANNAIAGRLKLTQATVDKWRAGSIERPIAGLYDVHTDEPRTIDDKRVARRIKTTLHAKPAAQRRRPVPMPARRCAVDLRGRVNQVEHLFTLITDKANRARANCLGSSS
jgi:hypothetical protein